MSVATEAPVVPTEEVVRAVAGRLSAEYGSPRLGNPEDPLDDLFFVLLSNRTAPSVAREVYDRLCEAYDSWESLADVELDELRRLLEPAGLSNKRSNHIKGIAKSLRREFGTVSLDPLQETPTEDAEEFLCGLPGVSTKVAKCVLMYGLDRDVLPVDVHVYRITKRLGWHSERRADQAHSTLNELVPTELRYGFHVNCVAHGRERCTARHPDCDDCPLSEFCIFYRRQLEGGIDD